MNKKEIKAVILGSDNIIIDSWKFNFRAWKKVLIPVGIDLDSALIDKLRGYTTKDTFYRILELYNYDATKFSEKEVSNIIDTQDELFLNLIEKELSVLDLMPGILSFLKELTRYKIKVAIASTSIHIIEILKKLDIIEYFHYIVNPKETNFFTDDFNIYAKACKSLKMHPDQCVGIESNLHGIEKLNDAKIDAIGINLKNEKAKEYSKYVLEDTSNLRFILINNLFNK